MTKKSYGALKGMIPYRYMMLMCGFFALYCGFIYNEMFSIPTNFWGSCYEKMEPENPHNREAELIYKGCTYPFGFDPKWYITSNEL